VKEGVKEGAKARNAAHQRALARGIPTKNKFAPKRVWRGHGFGTGPQPLAGASVLDRIVCSMEPGHWYARSDLGNLAGLSKSEIVGVRLFSHGYLTRRRNPDWKRWKAPPKERQPYWLYTLTLAGQGRQRELTRSVSSLRRSRRQQLNWSLRDYVVSCSLNTTAKKSDLGFAGHEEPCSFRGSGQRCTSSNSQ
jgi:hypothetical protein